MIKKLNIRGVEFTYLDRETLKKMTSEDRLFHLSIIKDRLEEISELRVARMNFILSLGAIYFSILAILIALNLYIPWSYYFSIVFFIVIYYTHYKGREKIRHIENSSLKTFDDIYRIHFGYLSKRQRK